jgi:DNA-binding CsgD family transcriptional regulator
VEVVIRYADGRTEIIELPRGATAELRHSGAEGDGAELWAALTKAESGVLTELAHRPDTRSRLAARLGITPSTLDNHLAAIKRKLLEHLESAGQGPHDGYLSTEMVIGWASRHIQEQKS